MGKRVKIIEKTDYGYIEIGFEKGVTLKEAHCICTSGGSSWEYGPPVEAVEIGKLKIGAVLYMISFSAPIPATFLIKVFFDSKEVFNTPTTLFKPNESSFCMLHFPLVIPINTNTKIAVAIASDSNEARQLHISVHYALAAGEVNARSLPNP